MKIIRYRLMATFLIAITTLLVGCASTRTYRPLPVNPGASVTINTQFEALPNASRVYFQNGAHVGKGNRDQWRTYCELFVYNPDKGADYLASVRPGKFNVTQVSSEYETVERSNSPQQPWLVASLRMDGHDRGPPSYYLFKVEMNLQSSEQADVRSLNCYVKASLRGDYYPTLSEIRTALGSLIEINLVPV